MGTTTISHAAMFYMTVKDTRIVDDDVKLFESRSESLIVMTVSIKLSQ